MIYNKQKNCNISSFIKSILIIVNKLNIAIQYNDIKKVNIFSTVDIINFDNFDENKIIN